MVFKRFVLLWTLAALLFCGCRKEADYNPYIGESGDLAYSSYTSQFDYLWKCMSTGYVFWDVDETDWDAVYAEYMPKFQALDAKHEAGEDHRQTTRSLISSSNRDNTRWKAGIIISNRY